MRGACIYPKKQSVPCRWQCPTNSTSQRVDEVTECPHVSDVVIIGHTMSTWCFKPTQSLDGGPVGVAVLVVLESECDGKVVVGGDLVLASDIGLSVEV